ncbi:MAG: carboxypeptidase-like regulatory domain-containing protein [Candidatus Eremiobacteraeota bacterium]|nr:carboxypeptidase-like regulatory domain-containing protein [Candidatus Eremiobacteraeota bacterium]
MALAIAAAVGVTAPAQAGIPVQIETIIDNLRSAVAVAAPSHPALDVAASTPKPKAYVLQRGGPLQVGVSGSLAVGQRTASNQLFGIPSPSASAAFIGSSSSSLSQAQESAGMQAEISRRTTTTMTDVKLPLGLSSTQSTQFGNVQAIFSTPRYALGYGGQTLGLFGQLPLGSTLRGEYAIVPTRSGDITAYRGPIQGAFGEIVPLYGVRWREISGRDLFEGGAVVANGSTTGKSVTFIAGAATTRGALSLVGEAGLQSRHGGDANADGLSYQVRADDGSTNSYFTSIVRHVSSNYIAFGNGEIYGDNYIDAGYRRNSPLQSFSLDSSVERVGNAGGGDSTNRQTSLNYAGPLRFGSYSLALQSQSSGGTAAAQQWQGTATTQISASLGRGFLLLSSQFGRTTLAGSGRSATVGQSFTLQEPLGFAEGGMSYTSFRQSSDQFGRTLQSNLGGNLSRTFGRASLGVNETLSHTAGELTNAIQTNTQLSVDRIISPAISVQLTYAMQSLRDRLNPVSNGRSKNFSIQINAPFAYGSSQITGRSDPRLPSTVVGRILTDTYSNAGGAGLSFAGSSSSGISNVVVVLDDKIVQRTDVTGGFQFSFVTPGQHQLRVENSSLPRGVTVDQPVVTLQVQGGQTAQVVFQVGNFGGITGHVYGRDDSGTVVPLPNVLLRVDAGAYSQTDATGTYGFGRLHPGRHTIDVILSSVPAFASFDPLKARNTVDVRNGQYTPVDFNAEPLGSIAGTILFAPELAPGFVGPVPNAYVVAEPGEHAAIVNDDGSFIVDNLPPGDYTLSVDPETLPEETGATPDAAPIHLSSQEHYQGFAFLVGHERKKVIFSFVGGAAAPQRAAVTLSEHRLPPLGTARIKVDASKDYASVVATAFGSRLPLAYDERAQAWTGELAVPAAAKAGTYAVTAAVSRGEAPLEASISVDPKLPIAIMQMDPANPQAGQYVRVRARFLVDAKEGDRIAWQDGQTTVLGRPLTGRVFVFSLRISLRPLHGLLLTAAARLPISLM